MAKGLDIRRRIKSVKSTRSITKAMQMVAASKMRKAQEQAIKTRDYARKSLEILAAISEKMPNFPHYLLTKSEGNRHLVLVLTSNKGLCGSMNSNVIRKMMDFTDTKDEGKEPTFDFVTVGKKGRDTLFRMNKNVAADFSDMAETPSLADIVPLTRYLLDEYKQNKYDRVYIVYSHFLSVLLQKPIVKRVVPLGKDILDALQHVMGKGEMMPEPASYDYLFEPNPTDVLDELLPRFVEAQVFQALLESNASEHSSRMVAMKNATEAAGELIEDLTLTYNKARQAGITQEISEIVGGVEALNKS